MSSSFDFKFDSLPPTFYLMQQAPPTANNKNSDAIPFSVGLVIVCVGLLVLLWLPDILKKD